MKLIRRPSAPVGRARGPDRGRRGGLRAGAGLLCSAVLLSVGAPRAAPAQPAQHLERPRALRALLEQAGRDGRPIVAMISIAGCPWCEAIRREQLNGLAHQQTARGIRVVEFDMHDETPFAAPNAEAARRQARAGASAARTAGSPANAAWPLADASSPATLARALGVRLAPTVVFLGPQGELAERLVGYGSPDFYSAYLDDRIERARAALAKARGGPPG